MPSRLVIVSPPTCGYCESNRSSPRMLKERLYRYLRSASGTRGVERQLSAVETTDVEAYSRQALGRLLAHAAEGNRYYARFAANGTLRLEDLPVLTKSTIRREFEALQSPRPGARTFFNSSG